MKLPADIILGKLESLHRCLERIESKLPEDAHSFSVDLDKQDIVLLNLERAIQLIIDIGLILLRSETLAVPQTYREIFTELEKSKNLDPSLATSLKRAVSFRNLAVHDYSKLDLEKVFHLSKKELEDFKNFGSWVKDLVLS